MENTPPNPPKEDVQTTEYTDRPAPAAQEKTPSFAIAPKPSKKKPIAFVLAFMLLVGLLAGGAYYYLNFNVASPDMVQIDKPAEGVASDTSSVPRRLLQESRSVNGFAVGYLRKEPRSAPTSWLLRRANAATESYSPVIFYKRDTTQQGEQIFTFNTKDKTSSQLTANLSGSSNPVFSSIAQQLAYNTGKCDVVVKDVPGGEEQEILKGADGVCYRPMAWSPDGKKLAVAGVNEDFSSSEWGMIKLFMHETDKVVNSIDAPTGFNSLNGYQDIRWSDENLLEVRYIDKGAFGVANKEQLFSFDTRTKKATRSETAISGTLDTIQSAGSAIYFIDTEPRRLVQLVSRQKKVIEGTDDLGTYLLRLTDTGDDVASILTMEGSAGTEGSFALNEITLAGGEKTRLHAPGGFSAYLLGWGEGYDEVFYMSVLSGKAELRLFNLETKEEEALVSDLPLIQ